MKKQFLRYDEAVAVYLQQCEEEYQREVEDRTAPLTEEEKQQCHKAFSVLQDSPIWPWGIHSQIFFCTSPQQPRSWGVLRTEWFRPMVHLVDNNLSASLVQKCNTSPDRHGLGRYCMEHLEMSDEHFQMFEAASILSKVLSYETTEDFAPNLCICEFPTIIHRDDQRNLHNETGPAMEWADGTKWYCWHGMTIPANVIEDPSSITLDQIEDQSNAEIRRVMVERYGLSRYLLACGKIIDDSVDEVGSPLRLYCRDWRHKVPFGDPNNMKISWDESIVMLEMTNSTKDPDGSVRTYMRRVPPDITSAIEARNWVCGLDEGSKIDVQT